MSHIRRQLDTAHRKKPLISAPGCIAIIISRDKLAHHPFSERLQHLKITGRKFFRL